MGRVLAISVDRQTAEVIVKQAQSLYVTPSQIVRERIYDFFGVPYTGSTGFLPKYNYKIGSRYTIRVYLRDDVYEKVMRFVSEREISLSSFIRNLFVVEKVE